MFLSLQSFHRFTINEVFQRLSADGTQAGASDGIQSSSDGRMVVFQSLARITPDDTNDVSDVYLKDLASGTFTRLSSDGVQAGETFNAQFSLDGRFVFFETQAQLTPGDTNGFEDLYWVDLSLRPYETAIREGRLVETRFAVGAASQVEIAWGDGAVATLTPAAGSVAVQHVYATTGAKAAVVTVHEAGQDWAMPFLVDLASGQMSRDTMKAGTLSGSSGADHLEGDGFANILIGNAGNDTLDGGAGADRLEGGAVDDAYLVDDASDLVIEAAGGGADSIRTAVSYAIAGDSEIEVLTALGSASIALTGNGSANTLTGNAGANVLHGGGGRDRLFGGAGNDRVYGDGGSDTLAGGAGKDNLYAAKGRANTTWWCSTPGCRAPGWRRQTSTRSMASGRNTTPSASTMQSSRTGPLPNT
jgi:Ca2+-binding RTX toxin-like protein